uniref:Uncharacterized protein n=1 Tax=Nitratidesulfovibrio vulgaris (strain DSM 19637 / Miyazaki F) TaxID=883 RepID=B8DKJ1_NITV9
MSTPLCKTLHWPREGADRVSGVVPCRAGGRGAARHPAVRFVLRTRALAACALLVCLLLPGPVVRAAGSTLGQDADAVQQFIRTGAQLADAYGAGPVCSRIDRDVASVRGVRLGSEAAMKRLLLVENDPKQEMLRSAFRRANESALRLERTLDGTGAICRQGGDGRIDSTGFRLRLENEALSMVEHGRTLCRTLRTEVPGLVWPDCDRP